MTSSFSVMAFIALALVAMSAFTLTKSLSDRSQRVVTAIENPGHKEKHVSTDSDGHDSTDYYPSGKTLVNLEAPESPEREG